MVGADAIRQKSQV